MLVPRTPPARPRDGRGRVRRVLGVNALVMLRVVISAYSKYLSFEVNHQSFLKFQLVSLLLVNMLMSDIRYGLNNVISSADGEKINQFSATG